MFQTLRNHAWWKDAAKRGLYTVAAVVLPYLGGAALFELPWITVLLAAALAFVASIITSLAGLPESVGVDLPWWLAAVERVVKTFFQSLAAGLIGAVLITDVDWAFVLQAAILSALISLLRLILATLPADPTPPVALAYVGELEATPLEATSSLEHATELGDTDPPATH